MADFAADAEGASFRAYHQKNALPDGRAQNKQISLIFRHRRIWHLAYAGCRVSQGRSLHRS